MPEFPFVSGGVVRTVGSVAGASTLATTVTASASANTKGTVVELTAATEFDASWMLVHLTGTSAIASYLVDILIGAATEQVIVPDLFCRPLTAADSWPPYTFPLFVPKGSRVSARVQASTGSSTVKVAVTLISGTLLSGGNAPAFVSAYGATATSIGTLVDGNAVADTDGSWTEITAATDRAHNWLVVTGRFGDNAVTASTSWRLSVGIGAATEQTLVPDLYASASTTVDFPFACVWCLPVFIPSGSRLTAKVRSNVTTAGDRAVNVKFYGAG